jgi:hypothetical protein
MYIFEEYISVLYTLESTPSSYFSSALFSGRGKKWADAISRENKNKGER